MFRKKNPTFAFTYLLKSPKSQNNANHTKERIQYENIKENIHQWCPFWTASAVKDFMFRTKNQECLQASIEGKKSKKEFLFSVYNMDKKRKPWMWYFPLKNDHPWKWPSHNDYEHTPKKKIPKRNKKKIEELCTHQICVHAPSSKSTTGHYSTIKIVLFAMSMCITSIIYLLLYGYTMITYLLIMMINTTTTTMYTKNAYHINVKSSLRNGKLPPKIYLSRILQKKRSLVFSWF